MFEDDNGIKRNADGTFAKGYSAHVESVRSPISKKKFAEYLTEEMIQKIIDNALSLAIGMHDNGSVRRSMITDLLDRRFGKPKQQIEIESRDGRNPENLTKEELALIIHNERNRIKDKSDEGASE